MISATQTFVMYHHQDRFIEYMAQTGIGTVKMRLDSIRHRETFDITNGNEVTITYNADNENNYNTSWRNYFNTLGMSLRW